MPNPTWPKYTLFLAIGFLAGMVATVVMLSSTSPEVRIGGTVVGIKDNGDIWLRGVVSGTDPPSDNNLVGHKIVICLRPISISGYLESADTIPYYDNWRPFG